MSGSSSLQGKALRRLYLNLFLRGRSARGLAKGAAPTTLTRKLLGMLAVNALVGLAALNLPPSEIFLSALYLHIMGMLFTSMFVAASTGEVIFHKEENEILGHRPVDPRRLLWAKISVLIQVSILMAGSYSLPGCIRMLLSGSTGGLLFPLAHGIAVTLAAVFGASGVVLLYQFCMLRFSRERLDNLMATAQVLLIIVLVGATQMLRPMLTNFSGIGSLDDAWWIFFLPPAWFAGIDALLTGHGNAGMVVLALLGIIATVTVTTFAFGRLAAAAHIGPTQAESDTAPAPEKSYGSRTWIDRVAAMPPFSLALQHPVVRTSFRLCTAYMLRSRDVKLRLYPGITPMLISPLGVMFATQGSFGLAFASSFIGLIPLLSVNLLQFSQEWQAADIFRVGPAGGPAHFIRGALMAVTIVLVLPMVLLFTAISAFAAPSLASMALLLPGLIILPAFTLLAGAITRAVPLSKPTEEAKSANRTGRTLLLIILGMVLGTIASIAWEGGWFSVFLAVEAAFSVLICWLAHLSISRIQWDSAE